MKNTDIIKILLTVSIAYIAVFAVALYTPMQSDDYRYYLTGVSFSSHLHHYLTWSGRVVADYVSTLILNSGGHLPAAILNSLAPVMLSAVIAIIPGRVSASRFCMSFICIFMLYWISNPNLGQTTFWVVGSANYLWTNVFIVSYLYLLINLRVISDSKYIGLLTVAAIFAGCSNENTSVTTFIATIVIALIKSKRDAIPKIRFAMPLVGNVIGICILLLSPGNFIRSANPAFDGWNSLSLSMKIYTHIIERVPASIMLVWPALLAVAILLFIGSKESEIDKHNKTMSFVFFALFLVSNGVLVGAPWLPPRSLNGGLVFLLVSLSYAIHDSDIKHERLKFSVISVLSLVYFIPSYYLVHEAYKRTFIQQELRVESLDVAKFSGEKEASVPDFWYTRLAKQNDKFDNYHNSQMMGSFFGLKNVALDKATFDYSGIKTGIKKGVNIHIKDDLYIKALYLAKGSVLIPDMIIMEFNKDPASYLNPASYKLFMHAYHGDKMLNMDSYPEAIKLSGRYYYGVSLRDVSLSEVSSIDIGAFRGQARSSFTKVDIN